MAVFAFLAGAWRKAKAVYHWNGSAWVKAQKVFIYQGGFQQGFQAPTLDAGPTGLADSPTFPASITFSWGVTGQLYGATLVLSLNGLDFAPLDAETNPTGSVESPYDPTGTWTLSLYDGAGDLVQTRSVTVTS